jgi:putative adhesin
MRLARPAVAVTAATAALVLALAPATAWAQRAAPFDWHGTVLQGGTVEIKGVNGDIKAEAAGGAEVEVHAVRTGRRNNPEEVQIEVVPHGDGVTICAVYPSSDGRPNECRAGEGGRMNVRDNDVSVAFTVRVPAGVRFAGRTVNGEIEATSLSGAVSLTTVNGSIAFSTASYGDATTVNGSITGTLGSSAWSGELNFTTVNGSITLDLPGDISTDLRANTVNGDITTDFPVTVSGRINRRTLNGTIGSGGRSLELQTVNGSVKLRRR